MEVETSGKSLGKRLHIKELSKGENFLPIVAEQTLPE